MKKNYILFQLVLLFVSMHSFSQIANYNFDNNFSDTVSGHDATANAAVNFMTETGKTYVRREQGGLLTLPTAVNNMIVNDVFQFSFDYRATATTNLAAVFTARQNSVVFFEGAGFSIYQAGVNLILNFDDNTPSSQYVWRGISTLTLNEWKNYVVRFGFANRYYAVEENGVIVLEGQIPEDINVNELKTAIQNNLLTVGGLNNATISTHEGSFEIDNLKIYNQLSNADSQVNTAFMQLTNHINNIISLSDAEQLQHFATIQQWLYFSEYSNIINSLNSFTTAFETSYFPLYFNGIVYHEYELPTLSRALLFAQNFVLRTQFRDGNAHNMAGVVFEHHKVIPGEVDDSAVHINNATVPIDGTYVTDVAAPLNAESFVVRPTGYYLKAGDVVTIDVPANLVNSEVTVFVGHHFRDMIPSYIGRINRFEKIALEYKFTNTSISVANPFGGGIYIKIPKGTTLGSFNITINNAIKMPYFSYTSHNTTSVADWLQQVSTSKAPWADFESDKFMFTIPVQELTGITNPDEIMQRWNDIMDAINTAGGRPLDMPRAEYYSFDTRLVTPAYGAGYPMIIPLVEMRNSANGLWNPLKVMNQSMHHVFFHEMGHNQIFPTLNFGGSNSTTEACHSIEAESNIHILAMAINSLVYEMSIEDAFGYSRANVGEDPFTFNEAVFDWIITSNFRQNLPMAFDNTVPMPDKDMLKYQSRSWAKYGDIVKLFGWDALKNTHAAFYNTGVAQTSTVCSNRSFVAGRDEYILATSNAVGKNVIPLFHFWGINPSSELQTQLATLPKSQEIKALIEKYRCEVAPLTMDDYLAYHNTIMTPLNYQWPRYLEYINQFDATFAQQIQDQFDFLLQTYGLIGSPAPTNVSGVVSGNILSLSWDDNASDETGYIIKMKGPNDENFIPIYTTAANATTHNITLAQGGTLEFEVTAVNSEGLESNVCEVEKISLHVTLLVSPKVYLQGASINPNAGEETFMRDDLRVANIIPTRSPYVDAITCNTSVFLAEGENAIVDWIFLELRNALDNTQVVASRSALLQRDGDVVDIDGLSAIKFEYPSGDYYIAIKHRNHLGIMSAMPISLGSTVTIVDFTNSANQITFGTNAQIASGMPNGIVGMWAGNVNNDRFIQYSGTHPDTPSILSSVLNDVGNFLNFPTFIKTGYNLFDINLDGNTQYSGTTPDTPIILQNVLADPRNFLNFSTHQIPEQIPQN